MDLHILLENVDKKKAELAKLNKMLDVTIKSKTNSWVYAKGEAKYSIRVGTRTLDEDKLSVYDPTDYVDIDLYLNSEEIEAILKTHIDKTSAELEELRKALKENLLVEVDRI